MERLDLEKRDLKKLFKENNMHEGYVFEMNGRLIKISKEFASDFNRVFASIRSNYGINVDQIEWLSSLRSQIKHSMLPSGVVSYDHANIGVIYPRMFKGYDSFNELHEEDESLLLRNMTTAALNNLELMNNGIYNCDLLNKNILYKGRDVQLIDLDGKYVKDSRTGRVSTVYSYFISEMYKVFMSKIASCHSKEEYLEIMKEMKSLFKEYNTRLSEVDLPFEIIDKVEGMKVLSR